ncbi:SCO family protein [Microbulbifer sp. SA54]|uniref:SCO family protein n=1 Tax=Microbulbifer sp. SA54 TaxID=3401577 RepID=UPI003AAB6828
MTTLHPSRRRFLGLTGDPNPKSQQRWERQSDKIPDYILTTQHGIQLRFYSDLVKSRIPIINFFYTHCNGICMPTTANLKKVHAKLGERVGRDILFLSISLDPERDTPAALLEYAAMYRHPPGWLFLTGKFQELEEIRRSIGAYDLDPLIDADREQHTGIVTFGNERTDRWAALPALMDADGLTRSIKRITRPT